MLQIHLFQWRQNKRDGVSNHRRLDYLLNPLLGEIIEDIKAPRHWPFVRGTYPWPMDSAHKGPVARKMFPFDDVIMIMGNGDCRST